MRAANILRRSVEKKLAIMHNARQKALWFAVAALINGGRLALTALGRAGVATTDQKNRIKRIDRLLGNVWLHSEFPAIYAALAAFVLKGQRQPVILVDWTPCGAGNEQQALIASVPVGGRAVAIYEEVHPTTGLKQTMVEKRFIKHLAHVLPATCTPIIVTDAGFKTPWFNAVREQRWEFLGRVRNNTMVQEKKGPQWYPVKNYYALATRRPRSHGQMMVTKSRPHKCHVVLYNKRKPGQTSRKRLTRRGKQGNATRDKKPRKREQEPWFLVTSLTGWAAKDIVNIYRTRMQTEETFRDIKNHRWGWSFEDARSESNARLNVLLLIAALAAVATLLVGFIAEHRRMQRHYQANTIRKRRVLSLFFLGKTIIEAGDDIRIPAFAFKEAVNQLHQAVTDFSLGQVQ